MTPAELAAIRKQLGYTQKEFAGLLGYSERQVIRWETGRSKLPRFIELRLKQIKPKQGLDQRINVEK